MRVARSGGIAGLTRRWTISAPPREPAEWIGLVERCPWDDADTAANATGARTGGDRFTWTIEADLDGRRYRAVIAEEQARGAWRELIDAIRAQGDARG